MKITEMFPSLLDLVGRLFPDPIQKAEAQRKLLELEQAGELKEFDLILQTRLAQIALNSAEAQSQSWFSAGWRPFIGWVCGAALVYHYLIRPLLTWGAALAGHPDVIAPELDLSDILSIMLGMLGLSGFRTAEKINRANKQPA